MKGNYSKIEVNNNKIHNSFLCPCFSMCNIRRWCINNRRIFVLPVFLVLVVIYYWNWSGQNNPTLSTTFSYENGVEFQIPEKFNKPILSGRTQKDRRNDTVQIFPTFNFSDFEWTNSQNYFWNAFLENRYKNDQKKFPLKIIVIPHSHNDPGWGWTYEEYFNDKTSSILNLAVAKLMEYPNMTFQWSEASFMDIWWLSATETQKSQLKMLIQEKRFEIVTGGWVMTDEAIVPLYSMIDQLVEGQHWFKYHLDVFPQTSWSVDPFGFGSALPYLLKTAGIDSMVILRIHYAWKKWMAENQQGDFQWLQRWDHPQTYKILCHQAFYTMYLIANSLGPHSEICRKFDFVSERKSSVTSVNIEKMAKDFVDEAGRTASLFQHNVAMPILGADFTFRFKDDWDSTYKNYMKLFDYINSKEEFNAEVSFGTLSEYFKAIRERQEDFPSITGDFFPYSDTESTPTGKTAYWSGFYSSRPFWKKMHRETEHNVRTAEILFTIANALKSDNSQTTKLPHVNSASYPLLVKARQYLALFAHHDAAPGVSSARVMGDYRKKLNVAIENSVTVQLNELHKILSHFEINSIKLAPWHKLSDPMKKYKQWENKVFDLQTTESVQILLFNSLGWEREQYVKLQVNNPNVGVMDNEGNFIKSQLNPVVQFHSTKNVTQISQTSFEVVFLAKVPSMSLPVIFTITKLNKDSPQRAEKSKLRSNIYGAIGGDEFDVSSLPDSTDDNNLFFMENGRLKLGFSANSGFLNLMEDKSQKKNVKVNMNFGGYVSVPDHSGPYLFMTDESFDTLKVPFLNQSRPDIVVLEGPISAEVLVSHDPIVQLSVRILQEGSPEDQVSVFVENQFDSRKVAGEFFMRFDTDIDTKSKSENGKTSETFYTDQSGYTFVKRVKVDPIGIEGNYYPITTMAFMEDDKSGQRLSLLVDRSHGAASLSSGSLEVMIERRLLHDDNRGIGQGIVDNLLTTSNYILKLEVTSSGSVDESDYSSYAAVPTLAALHQSQSLMYPLSIFVIESSEQIETSKLGEKFKLFSKDLPDDSFFLSLRTLPQFSTDDGNTESSKIATTVNVTFSESYSSKALMIVFKPEYSCGDNEKCSLTSESNVADVNSNYRPLFQTETKFHVDIPIQSIERTDLSGLRPYSTILSNITGRFEKLDDIYCHINEISSFVLTF